MATDLPPHVASGELITSPWGNAVVDEQIRQRGQAWSPFVHAGTTATALGTYDIGTTSLGGFAYPVRVTVFAALQGGFNSVATSMSFDVVRLSTGGPARSVGQIWANAGYWATAPIIDAWDVLPGVDAGFKTRVAYLGMASAGGTFYYSAHGAYFIQRTDV